MNFYDYSADEVKKDQYEIKHGANENTDGERKKNDL